MPWKPAAHCISPCYKRGLLQMPLDDLGDQVGGASSRSQKGRGGKLYCTPDSEATMLDRKQGLGPGSSGQSATCRTVLGSHSRRKASWGMEELECTPHGPQGLHLVLNGGPNAFNVTQGEPRRVAEDGSVGWRLGAEVKRVSVVVGSLLMTSDFPWLRERPSFLPPCSTRHRSWSTCSRLPPRVPSSR